MASRNDWACRPSQCSQSLFLTAVWLIAILLLSPHLASSEPTGTRCKAGRSHSTCVCDSPAGTIDLSLLSNGDGTSARFTAIKDAANSCMYSYNPCSAFDSDVCKSKVYICPESDAGTDYDIANDGTEEMWIDTDGTVYLYYTGPDNKETKVYLHCDTTVKEPQIETEGDSVTKHTYVFHITGCDVCPSGGGGGGRGHIGLIGWAGLTVLVVLMAAVVTYFILGALIKKFHYKATGTDIIPNKQVWSNLPFLVKDGCALLVSPCLTLIRRTQQKTQGYSEIQ